MDLIDGDKEKKIEKTKAAIKKVLASTKFADSPIVCVAACVGGGLLDKPKWETLAGVINLYSLCFRLILIYFLICRCIGINRH